MKPRMYDVEFYRKPGLYVSSSITPIDIKQVEAVGKRKALIKAKELYGDEYNLKVKYRPSNIK